MVFIHIVEDVISQVIFFQFCSGKGACGTRSSSCTCSSCRHCGCGGANSEDTNWTGIFALPKEQPRPLICPWELQILERGPKKSDWLHMEWSVNTVYLQRKSQVAPILASIWLSFYVLLPLSLIIISNWVLKMAIVTVRNMHLPIMFTCLHVVFHAPLSMLLWFKMVPHRMGVKIWLIYSSISCVVHCSYSFSIVIHH